ncbi:MAG: AfsR/SARP family transcriptional regulator [Chloroflexota bacterium]
MSTLRIRLFGSFELERGGQPFGRFPSRKVRDLFAYLALNRHTTHSREHLASLFWGDSDDEKARHSLNTALWRLNGVLETHAGQRGRGYLRVTPQEIGFNSTADLCLDVAEFESRCALAKHADTPEARATLHGQAVAFYSGDLLPDCYEDWCDLERERLQVTYLGALAGLVSYHAKHKEHDAAIQYARRILACDSLREEIHRNLIQLYLADGQPAAALRQYRQCEEVLRRELAVAPMRETQALLARILSGEQTRSPRTTHIAGTARGEASLLDDITRELAATVALVREAAAACNQMQARLQELAAA